MNRLSLAELRERHDAFAAAAERTSGVSPFCSGPHWQLAAFDRLSPEAPARNSCVVERDGTWLVFAEREREGYVLPFEASWLFGSGLLGEAKGCVDLLLETVSEAQSPSAFCLGGLMVGGPLHAAVRRLQYRSRLYREFPATDNMVIDLDADFEAWLTRRSKKFRRSLRAAEVAGDGIEIVDASSDDPDAVFARILAVQQGSYKWREESDIFQMPAFADFYKTLLFSLAASGGLRVLFARRDGIDLAHIFGGVSGKGYRGLQMSYLEEARPLGLGNRLQLENLRRCAAEGVSRYDLGMPSDYKERWADRREEMVGVLWAPGKQGRAGPAAQLGSKR